MKGLNTMKTAKTVKDVQKLFEEKNNLETDLREAIFKLEMRWLSIAALLLDETERQRGMFIGDQWSNKLQSRVVFFFTPSGVDVRFDDNRSILRRLEFEDINWRSLGESMVNTIDQAVNRLQKRSEKLKTAIDLVDGALSIPITEE